MSKSPRHRPGASPALRTGTSTRAHDSRPTLSCPSRLPRAVTETPIGGRSLSLNATGRATNEAVLCTHLLQRPHRPSRRTGKWGAALFVEECRPVRYDGKRGPRGRSRSRDQKSLAVRRDIPLTRERERILNGGRKEGLGHTRLKSRTRTHVHGHDPQERVVVIQLFPVRSPMRVETTAIGDA